MDATTKSLLREAGFENGSVSELLELNATQESIVESKVRLTALLREERKARGWSQAKLAETLGTKQQVVARTEMGHRSVTLDLLFRALLSLGVGLGRIARELEAAETYLVKPEGGIPGNEGNQPRKISGVKPKAVASRQSAKNGKLLPTKTAGTRIVQKANH